MGDGNASVGKASFWTSITGLVLVLGAFLIHLSFMGRGPAGTLSTTDLLFPLCLLLALILELLAVGCGIAARRTAYGKAGLIISGVLLSLLLLLVCRTAGILG
jgi:hypothetical protein